MTQPYLGGNGEDPGVVARAGAEGPGPCSPGKMWGPFKSSRHQLAPKKGPGR